MSDRQLEVWCFEHLAGDLTDTPDGLRFTYADEWRQRDMPPLSQSLPLDGTFGPEAVTAFFGGLLPEGRPREVLARQLGISASNDFSLLEALGGDTAGAVSLLPPGAEPPRGGDVEWLDERAVGQLIDELPARPMHADEDGEFRLSLAGAQDKLPVVVDQSGRIGITKGGAPSTHILKTPIERLDDTVANEAMSLAFGRQLGIQSVHAQPRRAAGRECLLVARYDRERTSDDEVRRLHQEDFCQALGVPSQRKYQAEGGPGLADCFMLIRRATSVPARDAARMLDYVALNLLIGNNDAHGKNFSLIYRPGSARAVLAPAYDVLSTIAYRKLAPMSRRMAMSIGGENRPDYVRARHLDQLLGEAGLGAAAARRRLRTVAREAPAAIHRSRDEVMAAGWDVPVLNRIVAVVEERSRWLEDLTATPRRRPVRTAG